MMAHMTQTPGIGTSPEPAPRKRRFRKALIVIGVLIVLAAGTVIYFEVTKTPAPNVSTPTISAAPSPAPTTTASSAPAPTTTFVQTAQADGCLGGPDPHTAVLAAQQAAALDSIGAAEFALAVTRFAGTYPFGDNVDSVLDQVMVNPAEWRTSITQINQKEQGTGNIYRIISPETWKYRVLNNTADAAIVQVYVTRQMIPTATQPLSSPIVGEYHLVARNGHWMLAETVTPSGATTDPTFTEGFSAYFGGC